MLFTTSIQTQKLIIQFECSGNIKPFLNAYKCPAGVWTIGIGSTFYENGSTVQEGDSITLSRACELFSWLLKNEFEPVINREVISKINQNQFDALVSFIFNIGVNAFERSTLLKRVNNDPSDPDIYHQFMRYNKSRGKVITGLTKRRRAEAELYFSKKII